MNEAESNTRTEASRSARRSDEGGFTLIEVMVVVLIIGILLAIGVPTFLGARTRAQDRAAQTSLRIAQSSAMVIFTDSANIGQATPTALAVSEPGIKWVDAGEASTSPTVVSVYAADASNWYGAAKSASGTCFTIQLNTKGAVSYGQTTDTCVGKAATAPTTKNW